MWSLCLAIELSTKSNTFPNGIYNRNKSVAGFIYNICMMLSHTKTTSSEEKDIVILIWNLHGTSSQLVNFARVFYMHAEKKCSF